MTTQHTAVNLGGRPTNSKNKLTIQLNEWFEKSLLGAESEFEDHPVMRLLLIGYDKVDCKETRIDSNGHSYEVEKHVPIEVQTKALSEAMKYIRSPAATKLEMTGVDGSPLLTQIDSAEVQQRLMDLTEKVNALTNMKVVSEQ